MKIAFIGLGQMGFPIAVRLGKAGYHIVGYDIFETALNRLIAKGYEAASSPADAAADADVVMTMVPDRPEVLEAAISGSAALTKSIRCDAIYIDLSTVDPATSRELHRHFSQKGVRVADAPVARSVEDAWQGNSAVMVGCELDLFVEIKPILAAFAKRITHCGSNGTGSAMKLVNNYINQGTLALIAEALTGGIGHGLTLELMLEVLGSTNAANANMSRAMSTKAFSGNFDAGFKMKLAQKDQRLALQMMTELGMIPIIGNATQAAMTEAIANGFGDCDLCSLFQVIEKQTGFAARYADP